MKKQINQTKTPDQIEEETIRRIYTSCICSDVEPSTQQEDANKVNSLFAEVKELRKISESVSKGRPVCPFCKKEMTPEHYEGYYESFIYWGCDCEAFPPDVKTEKYNGRYTGGC